MKTIQSTIVNFIAVVFLTIFAISCSKDDEATPTPPIVLSPELSFDQSPSYDLVDCNANPTILETTLHTLNIPIDRTVKDHKKIVIQMRLKHPTAKDLRFTLIGPNSRSIFVYRAGGTNDYSENNTLTFTATSVDMLDQGLISNGAIFTGNYAPSFGFGWTSAEVSLPIFKEFQGKSIKGDWKMEIRDYSVGDTGKLFYWKIIFQEGALN
jgi:subtilisin-like proprotein convertase family protein